MLDKININIFNSINHFAGNNLIIDKVGILLAEYLPAAFILVLIYLWFKKDKYKDVVLYCTYAAVLGLMLNHIITIFYFHPRPFMDHIGRFLIKHTPETSFPSDHTTFMLSIAFMLLYFKKTRYLGAVFSLLALIGGVSRVFTGIHYPFDIIGSIFVAIITSLIIFYAKVQLKLVNRLILNLYSRAVNFKLGKYKTR